MVVAQSATIGALPLAVARNMGCEVAYLPGLTMRRKRPSSRTGFGACSRRSTRISSVFWASACCTQPC